MRVLLAAALVAAFAVAPASAAPAGAQRDVRVTGRAGEVATFRLDRTTRIGHGGSGFTIDAPGATWSGVALTRTDSPASTDGADTYVHYRLHERLLCPGEVCEPAFQPTVATADDGQGYVVLRPGRYAVALLGPRGARMSVRLHLVGPRKGHVALRPVPAAAYTTTMFDPAVAAPGSDLASRGFARVATKGRHVVDGVGIGFVLARPSALQFSMCATGGGRVLDSGGGAVPCGDGTGTLVGPELQAVPGVAAGTKVAGIAWLVTSGRVRTEAALGYEAHIASAEGRIAALHFAVTF